MVLDRHEIEAILSIAKKIIEATEKNQSKEEKRKQMQLSKVNPNCEVCDD
jgi:hypothetical protein|tara:strand:- start:1137 stop:1286 length:150 start_codon:yes stop_codon:yes gene_type:complete